MTPEENEVEHQLVGWYLVHRCDSPKSSGLAAEVFGNGAYRAAWEKAATMTDGWLPHEIGLDYEDFGKVPDYMPPERLERLHRLQLDAYRGRRLSQCIAQAHGLLRDKGSSEIESVVQILTAGVAEAEAGGADRSETHAQAQARVEEHWKEAVHGGLVTLPMILPQLQSRLGGWRLGKLHLVVGRSSEHKTTLARQSAAYVAEQGYPAVVWTMEDDNLEMATRTICQYVPEWDTRSLATGQMPRAFTTGKHRIEAAAKKQRELASGNVGQLLRYIDTPNPTAGDVERRVRMMCCRKGGPKMIVLDFGQLIQPDNGRDDYGHWGRLPARLAGLAKDSGAAIVVTCQIDKAATRQSEEEGAYPKLSDIMGGAAWKQACFGGMAVVRHPTSDRQTIGIRVEKWKGAQAGWDLDKIEVKPERDLIVG